LGRYENGTPYDPKGGVRNVIPHKGHYEDNWKERYEGYREWKKKIPMKELARLEEGYNE